MASIPVDEVIAHLHGVGSEYIVIDSSGNLRLTGGGVATLDIMKRADGQVSLAIKFMFRVFEFRVLQHEWDKALPLLTEKARREEFVAGYNAGYGSTGEGHNAECESPYRTEAEHERDRENAWQYRLGVWLGGKS